MPKAARGPQDIDKERRRIFDAALHMICRDGFDCFSMRKLASGLGMTATTIYNYYSGKNELYLAIVTHGFELLHGELSRCFDENEDPVEKARAMIRAYLEFGLENVNYYNIMFTWNVPRYNDYVDLEEEPIARIEKNTALRVAEITTRLMVSLDEEYGCFPGRDYRFQTIQLWSSLHGMVSLCNSTVFEYVDENISEVMEKMIDHTAGQLLSRR